MTLRLAPLLFVLLTLAACNQREAPAPAPAATEAAATATPAPADAAVPAADLPTAPAAPAGPIVPPSGPAPVPGVDYAEIAGGEPYQPTDGKIEVAEVFSYTCGGCASFEPMLVAWKAKLPADVTLVPVAGPFGANPIPFAKAYYTAQTMGLLDKTHEAMFRAVHIERSVPVQNVTPEQIGAFYAKYGANPQQFASTMSSFAIDAKLKRGVQFMQRSGVESTPTIVVNGKYRVTGKTFEDVLRITDHLVAQERAKSAAPAEPAAAAGG
ncbi:MAG: thiol:disulfide interchange protein DsbA/DsbL [Lysobacter sp.]